MLEDILCMKNSGCISLKFVPAACLAGLMVYFVGCALARRGYVCELLLLNYVFFDSLLCV